MQMDLSRYRDKAYLVTYELTADMFDLYDIKVDDVVPIRSVYMLYTDKGVKILKKINYGIDELQFINSVMEHITGNGYKYVVPFMKTVEGSYYMEREDGIYVLLDLVEGREADFKNPIDLAMVSKALCKLHNSTRGLEKIIDKRNNLFTWIPDFKNRALDLLKFKEIAELHHIKSDFDNLFLKWVDIYHEQALKSIEILENSSYEELCRRVEEQKNICHHDLAYHNIIIDSESNVYFVDFDYCILDLRVHDLANLITKAIKGFNWDIEKAEDIIENYCSIDKISDEEFYVLYGLLSFPQDFYEVSRQYYMKTKNWDEEDFLSRLERKCSYYEDRKNFLEALKRGDAGKQ